MILRAVLLLLAVLLLAPATVEAGFWKLGRLGDEVGGAARHADGLGGLPDTVFRVARDGGTPALVLGQTDGHWSLIDELGRSTRLNSGDDLDTVLRAASPDGQMPNVVIPTHRVEQLGPLAPQLAKRGVLRLWDGKMAHKVFKLGDRLEVRPHPNISVPAQPYRVLREALYALDKPMTRVQVAELGKADTSGPRMVGFGDGAPTRPGETALLTPDRLVEGMRASQGGTLVLSGRVRDGALRGKTGVQMKLADLQAAADAADVHLIVIDGPAKRARRAAEDAVTHGDLLEALASENRQLAVGITRTGRDRIRLIAKPRQRVVVEVPKNSALVIARAAADSAEVIHAIHIVTRDETHDRDISTRAIPGIPNWVLMLLAVNLIIAVYYLRTSWGLFTWGWRLFSRGRTRAGRIVRTTVFIATMLVFGFAYGLIGLIVSVWRTLIWLLRLVRILPTPVAPA